MEETLILNNLFPTLISSIPCFSNNSKLLLLDSLSNLVKNHFSPEKFFTIRDLMFLTKNLDLSDYSSQAKLLDILDSFLDVEDSLGFEWVIFICEDHVNHKKKSQQLNAEGMDNEARLSQFPKLSKLTQLTLYSQNTSSNTHLSGPDHLHSFQAQRMTGHSTQQFNNKSNHNSNFINPHNLFSMQTGSQIEHDMSKSSSNNYLNRPENELSQQYNQNTREVDQVGEESEVRFCKYCSVSFPCKNVFAINKKILEEVFSKKRSENFELFFGKNFQVQEFTKGFSTVSVGTFKVSKFSLNHSTFKKMDDFVFSFLRTKNKNSNLEVNSSSSNMSPLLKNKSIEFFPKESESKHLTNCDKTDNLSIENTHPDTNKKQNVNPLFPLYLSSRALFSDPKRRFSLTNKNHRINLTESNAKRISDLPQILFERNLSIIKENFEGSETYNSGTDSFSTSSKPLTRENVKEFNSEEPFRNSIFQKLLIMYPQHCTCQEILSLKFFLNSTSLAQGTPVNPKKDISNISSLSKEENKIHLEERLTLYGEIFMNLIVHKKLFDMNVFVLILKKFVRIFFTQHQPLKIFKMLSSQVVLTRINSFPFVLFLKKIGLYHKKVETFSKVVEKLVQGQVNKGTINFEIFTDFLFVCFKNPFIYQFINKFLIFQMFWEFLTQNEIKKDELSKKVFLIRHFTFFHV